MAVKVFSKESVNLYIKNVVTEAYLLWKLKHQYIIKYLVFFNGPYDKCMALEFMEHGDLRDLIFNRSAISQEQVAHICLFLCSAVEFIHSKNNLHKDIKSANILISAKNEVKLSDFGMAECTIKFKNQS